jgi:hypothetical protein
MDEWRLVKSKQRLLIKACKTFCPLRAALVGPEPREADKKFFGYFFTKK